jgi:hypothetical protein
VRRGGGLLIEKRAIMETLPGVIQVLTLTLNLLKIVGVPGIISLMILYPGIIIFLWITHEREVKKILASYKDDIQKISNMYERNVSLVEKYEAISAELMGAVKANTQALVRLDERLKERARAKR